MKTKLMIFSSLFVGLLVTGVFTHSSPASADNAKNDIVCTTTADPTTAPLAIADSVEAAIGGGVRLYRRNAADTAPISGYINTGSDGTIEVHLYTQDEITKIAAAQDVAPVLDKGVQSVELKNGAILKQKAAVLPTTIEVVKVDGVSVTCK